MFPRPNTPLELLDTTRSSAEPAVSRVDVHHTIGHESSAADNRCTLRQHGVDGVEVVVQRGQRRAGRGLLRGDAEVEVDVRIHAGQHVLDEDRLRTQRSVERDLPRMRRLRVRAGMEVAVQRGEVAAGEGDVELLQARPVLELPLGDGGADGNGDPLVQRREVAEAALVLLRPVDDDRSMPSRSRGR